MQQIRLTKTAEIDKVLSYLRVKYRLLSEAEIIKLALSEKYNKEIEANQDVKAIWEELKLEGKKLGDNLLSVKRLKRDKITEADFYSAILKDA